MASFKRWLNSAILCLIGVILLSLSVSSSASAMLYPNPYSGSSITSTKVLSNFNGAFNTVDSPPSPVVAANNKELVQLNNNQFSITNRTGTSIGTGSASQLTNTSGIYLTDPQVMWDPASSRFYFSYLENSGTNGVINDGIGWGFSKTAFPSSAADFCSYFNAFNFGSTSYPDRPFIGDNSGYIFWGSTRYSVTSGAMLGSDASWVSKPTTGTTCPSASSFTSGDQSLYNAGSNLTYPLLPFPYYPVPAIQEDKSSTTWILGLPTYVDANYMTLIKVTTGSDGLPAFSAPENLSVPAYNCYTTGGPGTCSPGLPQGGSSVSGGAAPELGVSIFLKDIYMSTDPRLGHTDLWATNTVSNNGNSSVAWYEINPAGLSLDQIGNISSPSLDYFNSAIAPDRAVQGAVSKYGSDMAITYNSTSSTTYPAIWYSAKAGSNLISKPVLIKQSPGPYEDFACFEPGTNGVCRFGDWPGAAPDPLGATVNGSYGYVWISNEWNVAQTAGNGEKPIWRTEIARVGF